MEKIKKNFDKVLLVLSIISLTFVSFMSFSILDEDYNQVVLFNLIKCVVIIVANIILLINAVKKRHSIRDFVFPVILILSEVILDNLIFTDANGNLVLINKFAQIPGLAIPVTTLVLFITSLKYEKVDFYFFIFLIVETCISLPGIFLGYFSSFVILFSLLEIILFYLSIKQKKGEENNEK